MRRCRVAATFVAAQMAACAIARAHTGELLQPHDLWRAWSLDAGIVIPLALSAILFALGARQSRVTSNRRGTGLQQPAFFWTGWAFLALALISPVHPLGEVLFS